MPPQRTKKTRYSSSSATRAEPTKSVAIQSPDGAKTPERDSTTQGPVFSLAQKQALIDNLQLEITERARKLRAQYALHAQGLRSRLEMRINRIPQALRTTNIEELINRYAEALEPPKSKPIPIFKAVPAKSALRTRSPVLQSSSPARVRGVKRTSHEMAGSDKENVHVDLDNPKKRSKITATASSSALQVPGTRGGRALSRKVIDPSKVLSPKSHNSRQLPQSPIKAPAPTSPGKSYLARPVSPVKPTTSVITATASLAGMVGPADGARKGPGRAAQQATTASSASTGTARGRRGATVAAPAVPPKQGRTRAASNSSESSARSAATMIVTKKAPAKKGIMGKMTGMASTAGKKAAAKREVPVPSAVGTGGRVLRARR